MLYQAQLTSFGVKLCQKDNTLVRLVQRKQSALRGILKKNHTLPDHTTWRPAKINLCVPKTSETVAFWSKCKGERLSVVKRMGKEKDKQTLAPGVPPYMN